MYTINFLPILIASIVAFGISSLWYSPILFGKEWMTLAKIDEADIASAEAKGIWKLYVIHFITLFITFAILGFIISTTSAHSASNGAFIGFLVWIGFLVTEMINAIIWEKKPMRLALIHSVCNLLNLSIGGAIIGAWR